MTLIHEDFQHHFVFRPQSLFADHHPLSALAPILQSILMNRGIVQEQDIELSLASLIPVEHLKGISEANALLFSSLEKQKSILIIGDFDADGATSTALAIRGLRSLGFQNLDYLVPDRFKFGYGLSPEIVEVALQKKPDLIITVDNGISSIDGVALARKHDIEVLITDHHLPGNEIPQANAIVNPNQKGCIFSSKYLAGVGVMFYVLIALRSFLREKNYFKTQQMVEPNLAELLDLVALGTVADLVPLDHNNRCLVQQGLARIRAGQCCEGIKALLQVAQKNPATLKSTDLGFVLGPRINAAGRLDSMSLGIECLLSDNRAEAFTMAEALNDLNEDRKNIEGVMKTEALALLPELGPDRNEEPLICLFDERWHQGVVGIIASRLKEIYHLPAVVFAPDDNDREKLKGSARSISGLHMRDLLDRVASQYPKVLIKFGGHAMAAGMTIEKINFEIFRQSLGAEILNFLQESEQRDILQAKTWIDGELESSQFDLTFAQTLQTYGPWGQRFPEPVFFGKFEIVNQRVLADKHIKLYLRVENSDTCIDAIAFNVDINRWHSIRNSGHTGGNEKNNKNVHLIYKLDINEFRGEQKLQLVVEHFVV